MKKFAGLIIAVLLTCAVIPFATVTAFAEESKELSNNGSDKTSAEETTDSALPTRNRSDLWGVTVNDYLIDGRLMDLQDLLVAVMEERAVTAEGESVPLTNGLRTNNRMLEELSDELATLTKELARLQQEEPDNEEKINRIKSDIVDVKTTIDKLNNLSQTSLRRIQSYVSKRDDSFSIAVAQLNDAKAYVNNPRSLTSSTVMSGGSLTIIFGVLVGALLATTVIFATLYFKKEKPTIPKS